jgi:peptidoglycan/LPS O-acetylase OafA/YrhL
VNLRLDIQKLRTFAVLGVVIFHLWPSALPGGFIGVDVFFVISGFLISNHLFKELKSGEFSFAKFWARRARRILPSAVVVLAVTAIAVATITLVLDRVKAFKHILASLLFAENWFLAGDSVNYLAKDEAPLPTQHYWSLSVEEQFYLIWPVAIFLIWKLAKSHSQVAAKLIVGFIFLASYGYSITATIHDASPAYFSTFTRVWEFCAGALVALFVRGVGENVANALYYVGWVLLFGSFFFIDSSSLFPGYIALVPVLGAALIIWANSSMQNNQLFNITNRSNVFISDVSFALYLWHWPLIVFANELTGKALNNATLTALLILSALLAWLTTRFVEGPIRFGKKLKAISARRFLSVSLVGLGVFALVFAGAWQLSKGDKAQAIAEFKNESVQHDLQPEPALASLDVSKIATGSKCASQGSSAAVKICHFGNENASISVAVLGDSHMMALFPAVEELAKKRDWKITTYVRSACPFIGRHFVKVRDPREAACNRWNDKVRGILANQDAFDFVFVTANHKDGLLGTPEYGAKSFQLAWAPLIERGTKVVAVRDVPLMSGALECLQRNVKNAGYCAMPASGDVLGNDSLFNAAKQTAGVHVIDLTPTICPDDVCQIALNGYTVMRDHGHLTASFAKSLAPIIENELEAQNAFAKKG